MKKLMTIARQFRDDENGAALIEYTVLLGIMAVDRHRRDRRSSAPGSATSGPTFNARPVCSGQLAQSRNIHARPGHPVRA